MNNLHQKSLRETYELLEKRFEEIMRLMDEIKSVIREMKLDYLDERKMQVHSMRFNDILEELNEEGRLVLAICVAYEIRTLGECLTKPKRNDWEDEDELEDE